MPESLATLAPGGVTRENAPSVLAAFDDTLFSSQTRADALETYWTLHSGRERPGRYWRVDLDALDLSGLALTPVAPAPRFANVPPNVIACDLRTARRDHAATLDTAFVRIAGEPRKKFAALAQALANTGAFVFVPAGADVAEPIEITYDAGDAALFPFTLVVMERGSRCTVIERVNGTSPDAFVCGVAEILTGERADVTYASVQELPANARSFMTRVTHPGADARVAWAQADLGAALAVSSIDVLVNESGATAQIAALFFPRDEQHVDLVSTVEHAVGNARSETLVKSAAAGAGQARYLGNIRIAAHAQGSNASLRDDALLLSRTSHIDSVPALEIAANDVKAYHGATVGALDEEQIFYMTSRGLARTNAEKMIALGFFEPAIERFPTESLRDHLRTALEAKVN